MWYDGSEGLRPNNLFIGMTLMLIKCKKNMGLFFTSIERKGRSNWWKVIANNNLTKKIVNTLSMHF